MSGVDHEVAVIGGGQAGLGVAYYLRRVHGGRRGVAGRDGTERRVEAVLWCTGFRPATACFRSLGVVEPDGRIDVVEQRAVEEPRLWLAGYGHWTGAASATLVGAGRSARELVPRIQQALAAADRAG